MALFNSGNPTLAQKIFEKSITGSREGTMTVKGTMTKFAFLLFMVVAGACYTWYQFYTDQTDSMRTWLYIGLGAGIVSSLIINFVPKTAQYLAPVYGLAEGLVIGAFSAILNDAFSAKYPDMVMHAVIITLGIAIVMFLLYNFRIIQPTRKFKAVLLSAILGITLLYLVYLVLYLFGMELSFMRFGDTSLLGFGINAFVIVIASLSFILDFEMIETGAETGAPKYMEWYGAFGLTVTLIWLYIQILKLLTRVANSRNS